MKMAISNYYKPTPVFIRKLTDSIMVGIVFLSGSSALAEHPKTALITFIIGAVAKIVSNFYAEDDEGKAVK